jgi:hypothetical protein
MATTSAVEPCADGSPTVCLPPCRAPGERWQLWQPPGGSTICATVAFPGRSKADNAVVESFFRTLKSDLDHVVWTSRHEAAASIGHYIDAYYNPRRLHSTLGDRSPAQFEREHRAAA